MQAGQHLAGHGHGAPPFPMPPHPPGLQPPLPVSSAASLLALQGGALGPSHLLPKEDKGKYQDTLYCLYEINFLKMFHFLVIKKIASFFVSMINC